jgi:hypothetical protein
LNALAVQTQLDTLAALVVKNGVGVGRLTEPQRVLVLGLAWASLPAGTLLREVEVNVALKQALAGPCCFLGIDHVELRRWLVDCGWMQRDGFGREYRRVSAGGLAQPLQVIAAILQPIDIATWVSGLRGASAARRERRRQAWAARGSETAP